MSQDDPTGNKSDTPGGGEDTGLDLPAEMFRTGDKVEETLIEMQKLQLGGTRFSEAKFTEIDGMAFFEGDIVLTENAQEAREASDQGRGIGIVGERFRWPDGVVAYVTVEALRPTVQAAIDHWESRTPFRFVERTNEAAYISFEQQVGCWSSVGRQGTKQIISLGGGCGLGPAIHEIGHALGLWHEQSRSDRDDFIEVVMENVRAEARHNFDKHVQDGTDLGDYDFDSIMHYPAKAFTSNGQPTIRTKGGQAIGQRNGLSAGDINAIKLMYPDLNWPA